MDALLGNVVPAPTSKLDLTVNLGAGLTTQLDAFKNTVFGAAGAAGRDVSIALVDALVAEITAAAPAIAVPNIDANLGIAIKQAYAYGKAITGGNIGEIAAGRVAAAAVAGTPAAAGAAAAAAARGAGAAPAPRDLLNDTDAAVNGITGVGVAADVKVAATANWSNIKWLALAIAMKNIDNSRITAAGGGAPLAEEKARMNIRVISHVIAFGNNSGLLPTAAINLQNLLNSTDGGTTLAGSILGNPSVTDLHNTILARLKEADVESLTGLFGKPLLTVLRETFTGKLSVYDPYALAGPEVNPASLDFDRFLPADVLQAVLENRQKKFFPMARVNISPSYFGLFAPGNQLRFELQRGGASLDPNMPIEMRGRGSAVYGSAIKGGDYNNWQVVGKNAFISDKLDFALQTAIKRLGTKLGAQARVEIQNLITTLKAAEKDATEAAENLKTVVKAHQANGLTGDIGTNAVLKSAAAEYNNRIGKVAKVEGKLGRVYATISIYQ